MSQYPNDQWGQQPAEQPYAQQPYGAQPVALEPASKSARNDLFKSLGIGGALIVFTLVMMTFFDRLFYVLPIFAIVIIVQGVVKFVKARNNSPQNQAIQAWNQQQGQYQPQNPQQGYQQGYDPQGQRQQGYQPYPPQQPQQPQQWN